MVWFLLTDWLDYPSLMGFRKTHPVACLACMFPYLYSSLITTSVCIVVKCSNRLSSTFFFENEKDNFKKKRKKLFRGLDQEKSPAEAGGVKNIPASWKSTTRNHFSNGPSLKAIFSLGTVYAVQGNATSVWPSKWKLLKSTFMWYCLLCCRRWF